MKPDTPDPDSSDPSTPEWAPGAEDVLTRHVGALGRLVDARAGLAFLVLEGDVVVREGGDLAQRLAEPTLLGKRLVDLLDPAVVASLGNPSADGEQSVVSAAVSTGGEQIVRVRCTLSRSETVAGEGETVLVCAMDSAESDRFVSEVVRANNELAALGREHARQGKDLAAALEDLERSHWHLERVSQVLPICISCGMVKNPDATWEDVAKFLNRHASFLSHGYCPPCAEIAISEASSWTGDEDE